MTSSTSYWILSALWSFTLLLLCSYGGEGQTYHSSGVRMGAYLSIYSTNIGSMQLEPLGMDRILGNTTREDDSLDFLRDWGFNAISFYNLNVVLEDSDLTSKLQSYMRRARAQGITNIEAIGGTVNNDYLRIHNYQTTTATVDDEKFDGVITEIEFWHPEPADVTKLTGPLGYARSLGTAGRGSNNFYYCTYLGWVDSDAIAAITPHIDYMWPHSYSTKTIDLYTRNRVRIGDLVSAVGSNASIPNGSIAVTPIFSAEGEDYAAGTEFFGGDILKLSPNLTAFSSQYRSDWEVDTTSPGPFDIELLSGYQWYEYVFIYLYLKNTTGPFAGTEESTTTPASGPQSTTTPIPGGGATSSVTTPSPTNVVSSQASTVSESTPAPVGVATPVPQAAGSPATPSPPTGGGGVVVGTESSSGGDNSPVAEIKCVQFCDLGAYPQTGRSYILTLGVATVVYLVFFLKL